LLSELEKEFVKEGQAKTGSPSIIKECIYFARLLSKTPQEVFEIRQGISADVNEEYPSL